MANQGTQTQAGDPGRTPGSAEGDRETVEQDLREKGLDDKSNSSENESNASHESSEE